VIHGNRGAQFRALQQATRASPAFVCGRHVDWVEAMAITAIIIHYFVAGLVRKSIEPNSL
jgi:hypothetical protein